ncbi:MAG: hypothetical protein PHY43_10990 [Verrucomicrobiales bacterium]|nr:hypothetical protein [Verrucomicrobiales bacterium]
MSEDKRTPAQKELDDIVSRIGQGSTDPYLMQEAIRLTSFLNGTIHHLELSGDFDHYLTLNQPSAKTKSWNNMCRLLNGVHTEALRFRS